MLHVRLLCRIIRQAAGAVVCALSLAVQCDVAPAQRAANVKWKTFLTARAPMVSGRPILAVLHSARTHDRILGCAPSDHFPLQRRLGHDGAIFSDRSPWFPRNRCVYVCVCLKKLHRSWVSAVVGGGERCTDSGRFKTNRQPTEWLKCLMLPVWGEFYKRVWGGELMFGMFGCGRMWLMMIPATVTRADIVPSHVFRYPCANWKVYMMQLHDCR